MIEVLRVPIHRRRGDRLRMLIHVLDEAAARPCVADAGIDKQVVQVDDFVDGGGRRVGVPVNETDDFAAFTSSVAGHGCGGIYPDLVVQEAGEGRGGDFFADGPFVEVVVLLPEGAPGGFVFLLNGSDGDAHDGYERLVCPNSRYAKGLDERKGFMRCGWRYCFPPCAPPRMVEP